MTRPAAPGRLAVAALVLASTGGFLAFDLANSQPIDPFAVPPPVALGSGLAAGGAHCAAPPVAAEPGGG
jgi:hypothetical protein